ncbi:hypothetical protein [Nocardia sp. NPDC003963]
MDVPGLLGRAVGMVPAAQESGMGATKVDIAGYLRDDDWESALAILQEFDGLEWQSVEYWDLLAEVAQQLWLGADAQWCRWRSAETRSGRIIRATLDLLAPEAGGRRIAIPGSGELGPLWDIGAYAAGGTDMRIARIRVESAPEIVPGGRGRIRLLPLTPAAWERLAPGDVITMHERRPIAGIAEITEIRSADRSTRRA